MAHAEHKTDGASGQRPRLLDRRSCWRALKSVAAAVLGEPQPFCEGWSAAKSVIRYFLILTSYFPIGCGAERTIKISQSVIFLHAVGEIDRLATNFLILNSDFLTGSAESESKSPDRHRVRAARAKEARARQKSKSESYA